MFGSDKTELQGTAGQSSRLAFFWQHLLGRANRMPSNFRNIQEIAFNAVKNLKHSSIHFFNPYVLLGTFSSTKGCC